MLAFRYQALACALVYACALPSLVHGQSIKDKIKAKSTARAEAAKSQAGDKVDAAIEKVLDDIEQAAKCVVGDDECVAEAKKNGSKVVVTDEDGKILPPEKQPVGSPARNAEAVKAANAKSSGEAAPATEASEPAPARKASADAWANYDFVPGERVLFADDFSRDRVGNFPQRLELVVGNVEVVDVKGKRYVRATSPSKYVVNLPEALPQRFTIEFDIALPWNGFIMYAGPDGSTSDAGSGYDFSVHEHSFVILSGAEAGVFNAGGTGGSTVDPRTVTGVMGDGEIDGHLFRVHIHADGKYMKVYLDEHRIANLPNADFLRTKRIYFEMSGDGEHPTMVGDITVNAGGRDMYDALMADGRVVTQGILFDVGSDHIRPESTPTLKIIGDMLNSHADLNLTVEGHTDNTGVASSNQTLSEKRAAAIVAALTSTYGISTSRLTPAGFGASKPAKPNDTPEGRQQNRRVELVRR